MTFINLPPMEEREGLLDTVEKVSEARRSLEAATEDDYRRFDEAKRTAYEEAHTKLLD
jgi:hypothetical protein